MRLFISFAFGLFVLIVLFSIWNLYDQGRHKLFSFTSDQYSEIEKKQFQWNRMYLGYSTYPDKRILGYFCKLDKYMNFDVKLDYEQNLSLMIGPNGLEIARVQLYSKPLRKVDIEMNCVSNVLVLATYCRENTLIGSTNENAVFERFKLDRFLLQNQSSGYFSSECQNFVRAVCFEIKSKTEGLRMGTCYGFYPVEGTPSIAEGKIKEDPFIEKVDSLFEGLNAIRRGNRDFMSCFLKCAESQVN